MHAGRQDSEEEMSLTKVKGRIRRVLSASIVRCHGELERGPGGRKKESAKKGKRTKLKK